MNKTIIAIHGRASEGKSSTIREIIRLLLSEYPNARASHEPKYDGDNFLAIDLGPVKIGFESQGDPNSRLIWNESLRKLANAELDEKRGGCDIIICATRTSGATVKQVDQIADEFNYHVLWISSYYSPSLNNTVLNKAAARNITSIIQSLVIDQL